MEARAGKLAGHLKLAKLVPPRRWPASPSQQRRVRVQGHGAFDGVPRDVRHAAVEGATQPGAW